MSPRYQHILFDADGVLLNSSQAALEAYNRIRRQPEFSALPMITCRADMQVVFHGSLRTCLHRWLSPATAQAFFDLHSAHMAAIAGQIDLFPGVVELLDGLPPGSWSIVTSAYTQAVLEILGRAGSRPALSPFRVAGRELHQPKTEKIRTILRELDLDPRWAVYVGDMHSDILYCRAVPIDIIAVGYGYQEPAYLRAQGPTYLAESVSDLVRTLAFFTMAGMPSPRRTP